MTYSATNESSTWPTDRGPLASLRKLGLSTEAEGPPRWVHAPRTSVNRNGVTVYRATAGYLNNYVIRDLAALTFEGWNVYISPSYSKVEIKITQQM